MLAVEVTMTHVWWGLGIVGAVVGAGAVVTGLVYLGMALAVQSIFFDFWNRR